MYRITGAVMAALLVLMGACTSDPTPPVPETPPVQDSPADTMDERLLRIGKDMPGFGGMFFDDNGDLNVYVTEDVQTLSVTAREAQAAQAMKTISSVFGEEFLRQGRRHRFRQGEKPSRVDPLALN